jgi:hypothetical protein
MVQISTINYNVIHHIHKKVKKYLTAVISKPFYDYVFQKSTILTPILQIFRFHITYDFVTNITKLTVE